MVGFGVQFYGESWGDITADQATPPGVVFHPASGIDAADVAQVQAQVRTRILRAFAAPAA